MSKYYFRKDREDEGCYSLSFLRNKMKDEELSELVLYEAKIERNSGYFWCREFQEVGEVGEGCGKECNKYSPRNGKSGRCRYSANLYEQTNRIKILKNK